MALALPPGSEQYALARSILGGLISSTIATMYLVLAAYLLIHRKEARSTRLLDAPQSVGSAGGGSAPVASSGEQRQCERRF